MLNADFIVCFNGNLVLDKYGKIYYEKKLAEETAKNLISFAIDSDIKNIRIDTRQNIYSNDMDYCLNYNYEYIPTEKLMKLAPIAYTLLFENRRGVNFEKMKNFANANNVIFGWSRNFEQSWFMPNGSEKWEGVKIAIAEICKKEKHKTVAFGDELTDVVTFLNVDYPVPLINSSEEVLGLFDVTTKYDNDNNGVAIWLEENLLN